MVTPRTMSILLNQDRMVICPSSGSSASIISRREWRHASWLSRRSMVEWRCLTERRLVARVDWVWIRYSRIDQHKELNWKRFLDDSKIYRLQIYFGKAIRDNNNDLEKMKQAAWAAWYHMASTDDQPMHDYCNPDHCGFYLDFDYKHDGHSLPPAVCAAIKPAYEELCRDESLRQVLRGGTTNANESFHRIIWSMCSKKRYHTQKRIINATNLAVIIYNDGFIGLMPIYRSFGITVNVAMIGMLKKIDRERINEEKSFDPVLRLEQRRRNRFERLRTDAQLTREDPHKYGAGIAD